MAHWNYPDGLSITPAKKSRMRSRAARGEPVLHSPRAKKFTYTEAKDDFLNASWIMSEAVLDAECKALEDTLE